MPDNDCAQCWSSKRSEQKAPSKKGERKFANKKTGESGERRGYLATSEILRGVVLGQVFVMEKSRTVGIDEVGPVLLRRSKRAKRLSITIKYDRTVRVTVPNKISFKRACRFLTAKVPWVKKHLYRLGKLEQDRSRQCLPPVNRAEARTVLTARLNHLAQKHGFEYNRAFIRDQKTRWGSCSSANNINLNMGLLGLPQELADYVILHELVHTRFRNHSAGFWAELDRLLPDAKLLRRQLKEYGLRRF